MQEISELRSSIMCEVERLQKGETPSQFFAQERGDLMIESVYNNDPVSLSEIKMLIEAYYFKGHSDQLTSDPRRVEDFSHFKVPSDKTYGLPVLGMDCRALFDTLEAIMWVFDTAETGMRTPEWFAELHSLLRLVRERIFYLIAGDDVSDTDLNMDEYRSNNRVNIAFLWDFNSMLCYIKDACDDFNRLEIITMPEIDRGLFSGTMDKLREKLSNQQILSEVLKARMYYEYDRLCNAADRRIFKRKQPLRVNPTSRVIMINKREGIVDETAFPKTFDELLLTSLNVDALLHYHYSDFFTHCMTKEWFADNKQPVIIWIAARRMFGVVSTWPQVYECPSLMHAFQTFRHVLGEEDYLIPRGKGLPSKRFVFHTSS